MFGKLSSSRAFSLVLGALAAFTVFPILVVAFQFLALGNIANGTVPEPAFPRLLYWITLLGSVSYLVLLPLCGWRRRGGWGAAQGFLAVFAIFMAFQSWSMWGANLLPQLKEGAWYALRSLAWDIANLLLLIAYATALVFALVEQRRDRLGR
jgi:hypothetical protein